MYYQICYRVCITGSIKVSGKQKQPLNEEFWGCVNTNVSNGRGLSCHSCVYRADFFWNLTRESCSKFNGPKTVKREI